MLNELCITLTMRLVMLGHSLAEAHELAVMILIQLVLLCTLLGYRRILPDETGRQEYRAGPVPGCRVFMGIRGSIPAGAGAAVWCTCALIQHT